MQSEIIQFASDEEKYFNEWLLDAKKAGLVRDFMYQPKPFVLSKDVKLVKRIKKTGKAETKHLLFGHNYQADYIIHWEQKALDIGLVYGYNVDPLNEGLIAAQFFNNAYRSIVDVKGGYLQNFNDQRFALNQKWVYKAYGIYVVKIIPFNSKKPSKCLFSDTWTPKSYLLRKKQRSKKEEFLKCYCIPRTLNDYLNILNFK
jgi:hypothetical protein